MIIPKSIKLTALFLFSLTITQLCSAQSNGSWQPLWLSTSNNYKGIEGYYKVSTCNGSEVVMIKLENKNNFAVRAGWSDNAIDKNSKFIPSTSVQDSITIAPNNEVKGDCSTNAAKLVIKLSKFGMTAADFHGLWATKFDYIKIN